MDEALQKQIQARFEELPADVQQAIRSSNMEAKIQDIGRKHSLHLDQIGNLSDEVYLVMLGFSDPNEFPENLAKELRLPPEKCEAIAKDISESLFMPIRASMQQFAEDQALHAAILEEGKAEASAPAPASAPIAAPMPPKPSAVPTPPAKPPLTTPPPAPKPAVAPAPVSTPPVPKPAELHPADMMLSQKTVTVAPPVPKTPPAPLSAAAPAAPAPQTASSAPAPASPGAALAKPEPPAPKPYAADPYREPIQ